MYDPARDIFTASDEGSAGQGEGKDQQNVVNGDITEGNSSAEAREDRGNGSHGTAAGRASPSREGVSKPIEDQAEEGKAATRPVMSDHEESKGKKRSRSPVASEKEVKEGLPEERRESAGDKREREDDNQLNDARESKKIKASTNEPDQQETLAHDSPVPMTSANLPRFSRKRDRGDEGSAKGTSGQRRPKIRVRERRSPQPLPRRSPSPLPPTRRSPSPANQEPARKLKRPGGRARISEQEKDAARQRLLERDTAQSQAAQAAAAFRGVSDVVRQHYNAVPERGREFRRTDSKIRGLRSFNNWIKSSVIQKFSPNEDFTPGGRRRPSDEGPSHGPQAGLLVLDIGCGKGGDLFKWQQAPQRVDLYVGLDTADVSIQQARERYRELREGRGRRPGRGQRVFDGEFFVKDAFSEWLGDIPIIQNVGIDPGAGPGGNAMSSRWGGGGGFDVVSMMFCMHYAFENETKARGMLKNVAGALKKGGRFLGVIPNSDVLTERVLQVKKGTDKSSQVIAPKTEGESSGEVDGEADKSTNEHPDRDSEEGPCWGNSLYRVRFPGKTPDDGVFRPPFGWKYSYFMEEAVEEIPEYVVPWEAFRAIAEDYNLELQYRKPFLDVWKEEQDDPILGPLAERMKVREPGRGPLMVHEEEIEAAGFYHAFCFYKV